MRVMILAHDFPPYVSVGGLRPASWLRYLREFGVDPVVVTRQWSNAHGDERDFVAPSSSEEMEIETGEHGTVVRAPHFPNLGQRILLQHGPQRLRPLRRLITAWYELGQYALDIGPKAPILRAARAYTARHPVDAIVATGEPFVLFRYAAALSRELGVPWVADYRDPWSQDDRHLGGLGSQHWVSRMERRLVASASAITTVSESIRDLLGAMHPNHPIVVIPNGYDPAIVEAAAGVAQSDDVLTVAFTGSIYPWHPAESVFREFDAFNTRHPDAPLRLLMIGVGDREHFQRLVERDYPALAEHARFTPRLPNKEMARAVAPAHAFLMFNNYAYPGTKIFDYLALRRRILLCYSDDAEAKELRRRHYNIRTPPGTDDRVLAGVLAATGSGVTVRDAAHLRQVLGTMQEEFARSGKLECHSAGVEKFSRQVQAGRLADLLRALAR